jgi:hypothetical protein
MIRVQGVAFIISVKKCESLVKTERLSEHHVKIFGNHYSRICASVHYLISNITSCINKTDDLNFQAKSFHSNETQIYEYKNHRLPSVSFCCCRGVLVLMDRTVRPEKIKFKLIHLLVTG